MKITAAQFRVGDRLLRNDGTVISIVETVSILPSGYIEIRYTTGTADGLFHPKDVRHVIGIPGDTRR